MLGSRGVSVKTVWPCVPRHRVTHLHPMPSRITRNSHRPRASDRTMVASEATSLLAAPLNSTPASPAAEKLTRMDNKPNFSREVKLQWAGCRETISLSGQGGAFFLTFLFIERFDRWLPYLIPDESGRYGGQDPHVPSITPYRDACHREAYLRRRGFNLRRSRHVPS